MCILSVETLNFHMDKPIMTVATEIQKRWLDEVLCKQNIVLNNNYSYNCISLHHIVSFIYHYNIPSKQHIVQTVYRYNSIYRHSLSIDHIVRTASSDYWKHEVVFLSINRLNHIKNKGLPFYILNVYCCIYLSSRVNIFLAILFFSRSFVKWQLRENGICYSCWLGNHGKETWLLQWWNKPNKEWSTRDGTPDATDARYMAFIPCSYTERNRSYQEFTWHSTFCAMWCQITWNDFNSCVKLTSQTIFYQAGGWHFFQSNSV